MSEADALVFPRKCTKDEAERAWLIAWDALLWATEENPESIPELLQMGVHKRGTDGGRKNKKEEDGIRGYLRRRWMVRFVGK